MLISDKAELQEMQVEQSGRGAEQRGEVTENLTPEKGPHCSIFSGQLKK